MNPIDWKKIGSVWSGRADGHLFTIRPQLGRNGFDCVIDGIPQNWSIKSEIECKKWADQEWGRMCSAPKSTLPAKRPRKRK